MNTVTIETNVAGSFIVDVEGIRSQAPVSVESDRWDPRSRTLKLTGASMNCGMNVGMTIGMSGGTCVISNMCGSSVTVINGRVVNPGTGSSAPTKMYSRSWSEFGLQTPSLEGFYLKGSGDYNVSMPLSEDCDVTINGSGTVRIIGDHDITLTATLTGSGTIKGNGTISRVTATVTGSGDIKGFTVSKMAKGTV